MKVKGFHKVPGRMVFCDTWWGWVKSTLYCHTLARFKRPKGLL